MALACFGERLDPVRHDAVTQPAKLKDTGGRAEHIELAAKNQGGRRAATEAVQDAQALGFGAVALGASGRRQESG
jgi:hypothetical protein